MRTLIAFLFLFMTVDCFAAKPKWKLTNFEVGGVRFRSTDTSWETNAFFDLAWTPMWEYDSLVLHGSFQLTSARDRQTNRFLVTGYQGFVLLHVYTILALEAGAGLQTWHTDQAGTFPVAHGNLCLRVGENLFDRIYFGYGYYFGNSAASHILRAGTSFTL